MRNSMPCHLKTFAVSGATLFLLLGAIIDAANISVAQTSDSPDTAAGEPDVLGVPPPRPMSYGCRSRPVSNWQ